MMSGRFRWTSNHRLEKPSFNPAANWRRRSELNARTNRAKTFIMKKTSSIQRSLFAVGLSLIGLWANTAGAGTNTFDFNSDPSGILTIRRGSDGGVPPELPGAWIPTNGSTLETNVNPATNGYIAITQTTPDLSAHGMRSTIVFDDFDGGLVVAGFTFSCDVRIGAGNSTPADGFSVNRARH